MPFSNHSWLYATQASRKPLVVAVSNYVQLAAGVLAVERSGTAGLAANVAEAVIRGVKANAKTPAKLLSSFWTCVR